MKIQPSKTRIMIFGTFDVLHKGHLHFFRQARNLARHPYLIVSIARDSNVKRIKGKKPLYSEKVRAESVKRSNLVDKVVLGGLRSFLPHIAKEAPSIIALGYDQSAYTHELQAKLKEKGIKVSIKRLQPHRPKVYKSSLIKKKLKKTMV
jgi:FAD synthetase